MVIVSGSYGNSTTHLHLSNVYIAVVSIDGWTGKEWGEGGEGEGRRGNMYMRTHTNVHAHVHTHTHTPTDLPSLPLSAGGGWCLKKSVHALLVQGSPRSVAGPCEC